MDPISRICAGGSRFVRAVGGALEQRFAHLRATGVVQTDEKDAGQLQLAGQSDLTPENPTADEVDAQHHHDQHQRRSPGLVLE